MASAGKSTEITSNTAAGKSRSRARRRRGPPSKPTKPALLEKEQHATVVNEVSDGQQVGGKALTAECKTDVQEELTDEQILKIMRQQDLELKQLQAKMALCNRKFFLVRQLIDPFIEAASAEASSGSESGEQ